MGEEAKHTPGPWSVGGSLVQRVSKRAGGASPPIARVIHRGDDGYPDQERHGPKLEEAEANACLIAAAPELAEALKEALDCSGDTCILCGEELPSHHGNCPATRGYSALKKAGVA